MPNRLTEVFFSQEGKLADKWEQYLSIYDAEFRRFAEAGKPVRLLEIGVQNGGSLEVWARYLPAGSQIVGIDIDPKVGELTFDKNITAYVCDINDHEGIRKIIGSDKFDIIIDDGSHTSSDIISTFNLLFEYLAPGGKFIAEDLHASYWQSHEGGFRLSTSAIEYFKNIVDGINLDYIEVDIDDGERKKLAEINRDVVRLSFYDSVVVVEKHLEGKMAGYRRVLSGVSADVVDPVEYMDIVPAYIIKPLLVGDAACRHIEANLLDLLQQHRERIAELQAGDLPSKLVAAAEELAFQHRRADALDENLALNQKEIYRLNSELLARQKHIDLLSNQLEAEQRRSPARQALKRAWQVVENASRRVRPKGNSKRH